MFGNWDLHTEQLVNFCLAFAIAIHLAEIFQRTHRLSTWPVLAPSELSTSFRVNAWSGRRSGSHSDAFVLQNSCNSCGYRRLRPARGRGWRGILTPDHQPLQGLPAAPTSFSSPRSQVQALTQANLEAFLLRGLCYVANIYTYYVYVYNIDAFEIWQVFTDPSAQCAYLWLSVKSSS